MAQKIIGRKQESKELLDLYKENKPVFAVIYGRRRVGKTFLVRELFQDKMSFYHTGLPPYELSGQKIMEQQLTSFYSSLVRYGSKSKKVPPLGSKLLMHSSISWKSKMQTNVR